jgi:hypothetical protein
MTGTPAPNATVEALAVQLGRTFTTGQLAQLDAEAMDRPDMNTGPWQTIADAINRAAAEAEADSAMISTRVDDPPSPQQVVDALRAAGFTRASASRAGVYARMWWPEHVTGGTMLVTLDPEAEEHDEEMTVIRRKLEDAAARGRVAQQALDAIGWTETDQ